MADASPVQMWTARPDGGLDYVNRRITEFFGRSSEQMLGEGWQSVLHPADVAAAVACWTHSLTTGEPYQTEFRLLRAADGQFYWYLAQAEAIRDAAGRIIRWVGTNTDINALKRSVEVADARKETTQRERERLLRAFHYAPAVVALYTGPQFVIAMVNPLWEAFVGKSNVIGKTVRELFPELEGQAILQALEQVYATGQPYYASEVSVQLNRRGTNQLEETYWNLVMQPLSEPGEPVNEIMTHAVEVTELVLTRRRADRLQQQVAHLKD